MSKKISVIIPALNESGYIEKAIASLMCQTIERASFEIIVVDNGSVDDTAELARRSGADCVLSEPKKGTNRARARGLATATAPIVAFLDADCEAPKDWLMKIIEAFEADCKLIALGGPYNLFFKSPIKRCVANFFQLCAVPVVMSVLSFLWKPAAAMNGGNWAARRTVLNEVGIDARFSFYGDDTAVACALAKVGKVRWLPHLGVKTSLRRYETDGDFALQAKYIINWFWVYLFNRPIEFRDRLSGQKEKK